MFLALHSIAEVPDNTALFQTSAYTQLNYNTTGRCDRPLVRTVKEDSWWEGLEGCGVQCQSPLYSESEHRQAHSFVAVMGALCLISTLFTIVSRYFLGGRVRRGTGRWGLQD